ncbi:MAG: hypothetical protein WDN49_10790 [Acetobacteraceae bacterium]
MVIQPRVLLLDEPLSNLDANLREEMRFEIRRLHDAFHFTTVYVTHDQSEAMVTSDRIAVMNAGRIEQIDAPYTLYTRPKTRFRGQLHRPHQPAGRRLRWRGASCLTGSTCRAPGSSWAALGWMGRCCFPCGRRASSCIARRPAGRTWFGRGSWNGFSRRDLGLRRLPRQRAACG